LCIEGGVELGPTAWRFPASKPETGMERGEKLALGGLHPYNPLTGIMFSRLVSKDGP
jgi:hypothetical protein